MSYDSSVRPAREVGDRVRVSIGLILAQLISLVRAHAGDAEVRLTGGLGGVALDTARPRDNWGWTRLRGGREQTERWTGR